MYGWVSDQGYIPEINELIKFLFRCRLDVVRTPVKREDVCKPIILPDGRAVYRCSYCNKDFGSFSDVNRHMDFHEGQSRSQ